MEQSGRDRVRGVGRFSVRCIACESAAPQTYQTTCDECGGRLDVEYDLERVTLHSSDNPFVRFRDLLPVRDPALLPSDAQCTPTIHARRLGEAIGLPGLYLKDESVLPTGSTKDRMAAVALAYLHEHGVRRFATSSTGNSSTAFARALGRFPAMSMHLFTASRFRHRVRHAAGEQVSHVVLRDATFVDAYRVASEFAARYGVVSEGGFFNPGRREGLKLAFLEATDQVPLPIDWYVQAVSSAMGVVGTHKAARELLGLGRIAALPRLLGAQQESCAPMVRAWHDESECIRPEHIVLRPSGIAEAILRGDPSRAWPHVRRAVQESDGDFVAVSDVEIREAQRLVRELEGLRPCLSASVAVAGLMRAVRDGVVGGDRTVLVNLTGGDVESPIEEDLVHELVRTDGGWVPAPGGRRRPPVLVHERFEEQARRTPHAVAVEAAGERTTFAELDARANRVAARVLAACAPGDEHVGVAVDHDSATIAALLGVLKAGRTYVPLDPEDAPERLRFVVEDADVRVVVTGAAGAPAFRERLGPSECSLVELGADGADAPAPPSPELAGSPDAPACLFYTSGSTGRPKGVLQTHRAVLHHVTNYSRFLSLTSGDRVALLPALTLSAAGMDLHGALLAGATLLPYDVRRCGTSGIGDWIRAARVTVVHAAPTLYRQVLRSLEGGRFLDTVRVVDLGGEAVHAGDVALHRRLVGEHCALVNHFAATEISVIAQHRVTRETDCGPGPLPAGRAAEGVQIRVVREDGSTAAPDEVGEITVVSRFVTPGYWGRPELTAAAIARDSAGCPIYRTGDLGRVDDGGVLHFVGRTGTRTKVRGHTVDLTEVEAALRALGPVREAAVAWSSHDDEGEDQDEVRLVAGVVLRGEHVVDPHELRRALRRRLPDPMVPSRIEVLEALPTTVTGKIDRLALARRITERRRHDSGVTCSPGPEGQVATMFEQLLAVTGVGRHDSFFDVGGDSLKALQLHLEIHRTFGVDLSPSELLHDATPAGLAARIARAERSPGTGRSTRSVLLPVRTAGAASPLFLVHGVTGQAFVSPGFVRMLGPEQPLYVFQVRGLRVGERTNRTLTAMAADYVRAMKEVQPEGPYRLGGICAGGYVALEMARQLRESGAPAERVLLIDPPRRYLEPLPLMVRWKKLRSLYASRLPWSPLVEGGKLRRTNARLRRRAARGRFSINVQDEASLTAGARAAIDFEIALLRHRPRPFDGEVRVIGSRERRRAKDERADGPWHRHVSGKISFREAAFEHRGVLHAGNHAFEAELRAWLDGAPPRRSAAAVGRRLPR